MIYPCGEMIEDYIDVFSAAVEQIRRRNFRRPSGILQPPPAEVNGVGILPLEFSYKVERVGFFPAQSPDYEEFAVHTQHRNSRFGGGTTTH
jgi:hypothetical protein